MLKTLVLTVFSLIVFVLPVSAKIMPLVQNLTVYIPVKQFSVLEFPFLIKEKRFTPFVYKVRQSEEDSPDFQDPLKNKIELPKLNNNGFTKQQVMTDVRKKLHLKQQVQKSSQKPFTASWGKNFVQLYANTPGQTEVVIWGYSKYPILLTLVVTRDKTKADTYIKFVNYDKKFTANENFKHDTHEKICSKLIYFLYNNITPSGFKVQTQHKIYKSKNLQFILIKSIVGRFYSAIEYKVTNISGRKLKLNEPDFASNDTYAISIVNRDFKSGETTKMFVVTPTIRQKDE